MSKAKTPKRTSRREKEERFVGGETPAPAPKPEPVERFGPPVLPVTDERRPTRLTVYVTDADADSLRKISKAFDVEITRMIEPYIKDLIQRYGSREALLEAHARNLDA